MASSTEQHAPPARAGAAAAEKNLTLDAFRLVASLFVVLIHFALPGRLDVAGDSVARFAVPFFFAASGYFASSLATSESWTGVRRRFVKVGRMLAWASVLYLVWRAYRIQAGGGSVVAWLERIASPRGLLNILFFNQTPWAFHLWFLPALIYCHVAFKAICALGLNRRELLCGLAAVLLVLQLTLGEFSGIVPGSQVLLLRNWLFIGLPFYLIGYVLSTGLPFPQAMRRPGRLWLCALVGASLCVIERLAFGISDVSAGSIIVALSLMGIAIASPRPRFALAGTLARWGSRYSGNVYILHKLIGDALVLFVVPVIGVSWAEKAALPFVIFALSLLASAAIFHIRRRIRLRRGLPLTR